MLTMDFAKFHNGSLKMGDLVEFYYNDKFRVGFVEKVARNTRTLATIVTVATNGEIKSFCLGKMEAIQVIHGV